MRDAKRRKPSPLIFAITVVATLSLLLAGGIPSVEAGLNHRYSVAHEQSPYGGIYTGVGVYRWDNHFNLPGTNCAATYTVPVVYQAQWAIISNGNWVEMGTGHHCQNYRFWYWGYGSNGNWFSLGTQANIAVDDHNFYVSRQWNGGNPRWRMIVDSTVMGAVYWNTGASRVDAGYESWEDTTTAAAHGYQNLRFHINDGAWQSWSGKDAATVTPGLCGRWASSTDWRASENWGSC